MRPGEVYCEAPGSSEVVFSYGFGSVPGIAIVGATIRADGAVWSLGRTEGAIPIILMQASLDSMRTIIDFG